MALPGITEEQRLAGKVKLEKKINEFIRENKYGRGLFIKALNASFQNTFIKAYDEKSKANAIKAKCQDCCCFVRDEITKCEAYTCPLWEVRPYQGKLSGKEKGEEEGKEESI